MTFFFFNFFASPAPNLTHVQYVQQEGVRKMSDYSFN